jgi:hypothetical protein
MIKRDAKYLVDMRMWQPKPTDEEKLAAAMSGVTLQHHYTQAAVRLYNECLFRTFVKEKTDDVESGLLTIDFRNKRGGFLRMLRAAGMSSREWAERYYQDFIKGGLMYMISEGTGKNTGKVEVKMTPSKLYEFPEQPQHTTMTEAQRAKGYRERRKSRLQAEVEALRAKVVALEAAR